MMRIDDDGLMLSLGVFSGSEGAMVNTEYSATEVRWMLQQLFPQRKLVLSQLTFFNQSGVGRPTGSTFRRGRRCYKLTDVLPIACVLALKERGIPLKNISPLPGLIQSYAQRIFSDPRGCQLSGYGLEVSLVMPGESLENTALDAFLKASEETPYLFWNYDIAPLIGRLFEAAESGDLQRKAA
jgi:hypothetical protein